MSMTGVPFEDHPTLRSNYQTLAALLQVFDSQVSVSTEAPHFTISTGDLVLTITVAPWNDRSGRMVIDVPMVDGVDSENPALTRYLLSESRKLTMGWYYVNEVGAIGLRHTALIVHATSQALATQLELIFNVCRSEINVIQERFGGQRIADRLLDALPAETAVSNHQVLRPVGSGIGDSKVFFFLFGLRRSSASDQRMLHAERAEIDDDILKLRLAGYTVVLNEEASRRDFFNALYGETEGAIGLETAGVYWSAHGFNDGSVQCCEGTKIRPQAVVTDRVQDTLRLVVFAACYTGAYARTWREAFGTRAIVVGWGRVMTITRAVAFLREDPRTQRDFDDLIDRYLLSPTPLPRLGRESPRLKPIDEDNRAKRHPTKSIMRRVEDAAEMLRAEITAAGNVLDIRVPLAEDRYHIAQIFVLDSQDPYNEGKPMLAIEADVGELTEVVDPHTLFDFDTTTSYARLNVLDTSNSDQPRLVVQGALPIHLTHTRDLAALMYHVCAKADALELRIFGTNSR